MKRQLCWAAAVSLVFLTLAPTAAFATSGLGRVTLMGPPPDIIFREGIPADRTIVIRVRVALPGTNYQVYARSGSSAISIMQGYPTEPTGVFRTYPTYAVVAPAMNPGDEENISVVIRYNGGVLGANPGIELADNASQMDAGNPTTSLPGHQLLGYINVFGIGAGDPVPTTSFTATCTSGNRPYYFTQGFYIVHPLLNGKPNARFQVTQNWNPPSLGGVYNNNQIGVLYDGFFGLWLIVNQSAAAMPIGASFNVKVDPSAILHVVSPPTIGGVESQWSRIEDPRLNNNPNALVHVTHYMNGVYQNYGIGAHYDGSRWAVLNQDQTAI